MTSQSSLTKVEPYTDSGLILMKADFKRRLNCAFFGDELFSNTYPSITCTRLSYSGSRGSCKIKKSTHGCLSPCGINDTVRDSRAFHNITWNLVILILQNKSPTCSGNSKENYTQCYTKYKTSPWWLTFKTDPRKDCACQCAVYFVHGPRILFCYSLNKINAGICSRLTLCSFKK